MFSLIKKIIPQSLINNYHLFLAIFANIYYRFPSKKLYLIGVTGTKGKTTTANYLFQLLQKRYKTGLISTTGVYIGDHHLDIGPHTTTPSSFELQKILKDTVNQKIKYLVIETSSHGFDQNRLWGLHFDIGIITNIDNDHLDYHLTWENYANAKAKLIKQLKPRGLAILNLDDQKSFHFLKKIASEYHRNFITYGVNNSRANYNGRVIKNSFQQIDFSVSSAHKSVEKYSLGTFGLFNLYNAISALIAAKKLGISGDQINIVFKNIIPPPGRMEVVQKEPFTVLVDFAHNTYSLENALKNLTSLMDTGHRLISVFGCPGRRDHNRRQMGYVSAKYSNLTIITADDPRDEGVEQISLEVENWAKKGKAKQIKTNSLPAKGHFYTKIPDRGQAIKYALNIAKKNDIVYITGMGDQHMMAVGNGEIHWNDKEEIEKILSGT